MKRIILVILAIGIFLVAYPIFKYENKREDITENQIVKFVRKIPVVSNYDTFSNTMTYEVDFSNNKVKMYDNKNSVEYELSTDQIEWLKVSIAHCFENENLKEDDLKKSTQQYYVIKVDDNIFLENRIDRVKQITENLENRKDD